jgi:hypothetical protein
MPKTKKIEKKSIGGVRRQDMVAMNVINKKRDGKPAAAYTEPARQIKHRLRLPPKEGAGHPPKKAEVRLGVQGGGEEGFYHYVLA